MLDTLLKPLRPRRTRASVQVIGLDIGARTAKCVVRDTRRGATRIAAANSHPLAWDEILTPRDLVDQLAPLIRACAPARPLPVICSFPAQMAELESFDADLAETESPRAAAQHYLERLLGTASQETLFDLVYNPVPAAGPSRMRLHLAWINRAYAEQFSQELDRTGYRCTAIDAVPAALARLGAEVMPSCSSTLVVNLGAENLTFVSVADSVISYVRNRIRFVPGSAVDNVSAALNIRPEAAETLLSEWGLHQPNAAAPEISRRLTSLLSGWLHGLREEIAKTAAYLQQASAAESISRIVLCGAGANLRGLDRWLSDSLNFPVELAGLPPEWRWDSAEAYSPAYAQAVALTQHGDSE